MWCYRVVIVELLVGNIDRIEFGRLRVVTVSAGGAVRFVSVNASVLNH